MGGGRREGKGIRHQATIPFSTMWCFNIETRLLSVSIYESKSDASPLSKKHWIFSFKTEVPLTLR